MNDSLIESIQISKNEIQQIKKVGGGNYGDVWEAKCRGYDVIVKVPKIKNMNQSQVEEFYDEIMKMCKLRHPNIVLLMGAHIKIEDDLHEIQIVMEKLEIDLKNMFKNPKKYPLTLFESVSLAKQAAVGMMWLHEGEVIHCDYKPANLLYSHDTKMVKICDFGFSKLLPKGEVLISHSKGTPTYAAPEIFLDEPTSFARDVYSFGISLFPHVARKEPHEGWHGSIREFAEAVVSDSEPLRPKLPKEEMKCPKSLRKLAHKCWETDQYSRPSFSQIVSQLDSVLIDCAIFDIEGRKFWEKYFNVKGKLSVNVDEQIFVKHFLSEYSILPEDIHKKLVKVLFVREERVNIEHFGKILGFFESLSLHDEEGWVNWLVKLFTENKYIFGKESILLDSKHYLVRFSSENYDWSLVCGDQKIKINHSYASNTYTAGSITADNLPDCVSSIIISKKWNAEPANEGPNSFYALISEKKVETYI